MKISEKGLSLIKESEGLRQKAYLDSVGVPTIGFGHTKGVKLGQEITYSQAVEYLKEDLREAEQAVLRLVKVQLSQGQFDALVSFVFNLGAGAFAKSTLLKKLNARDYSGAANEFGKWVNAGGRPLKGLITRREGERRLFLER